MATFTIPLSGVPESFAITLAGVPRRLTVAWREAPEGGWFLDVANADGAPLLAGVPLVPGQELLASYPHLALGGALTLVNDGAPDAAPGFGDLGRSARLVWTTP